MLPSYFHKACRVLHHIIARQLWLAIAVMGSFLLITASTGKAAPLAQRTDIPRTEIAEFPTNEWAIKLPSGVDPDALAAQHGFENLGQIGPLENFYLFRRPTGGVTTADVNGLSADSRVLWLEQQIARQQYARIIPDDPLYGDQWHLHNTGQLGGTPGVDANVVPVWTNNITGAGVVIAVVDNGLQHTHPDFASKYIASASFDFNDNDWDPSPGAGQAHGAAVGGVAAAGNEGTCGVGAAFGANIAGLRLVAAPSTDAQEALALTFQYNTIHIFSNSWGPADGFDWLRGPGLLTRTALEYGVTHGRNGLGNIYVWAAGNGLWWRDNVNYDGYANSRHTIAIGAIDNTGKQAEYSEPGAAMLVTAPSSRTDGEAGITTTDLLGGDGASPDDCRSNFGGTSSAAPLVSGVIALMLEANPNLGWRDVQHILVETAVKNDPDDSDWTVNGAGHEVNHKYGFGRIDAEAAVNAASSWTNVVPAITVDGGAEVVTTTIPDNDPTGVTSTQIISDSIILEHVEVVFTAIHTCRGDLKVVLTSPSGTQSVLAETHFTDWGDDYSGWKFMSVRHWGERSQGPWSLKVEDTGADDEGTFVSWQLVLHGTSQKIYLPIVFKS